MFAALLLSICPAGERVDIEAVKSRYLQEVTEAVDAYREASQPFADRRDVARELAALKRDPSYRPQRPPAASAAYEEALDRAAADCRRKFERAAADRRRLGYPSQADRLLAEADAFLHDAVEQIREADVRVGKRDVRPMRSGQRALANRAYRWSGVPESLSGKRFIAVFGGRKPLRLTVLRGGRLCVAVTDAAADGLRSDGWTSTGDSFACTDPSGTRLTVYEKTVEAGELTLPGDDWIGPVPIVP